MARSDEVKPAGPSATFTYADFINFPNDGKRHEIVDGEHHVTPSPGTAHQKVALRIATALSVFVDAHHLGAVFAAPFDVVLSDLDVVEPDVLYISRERRAVLTDQHVRGAPDLVVEVLSPGTRRVDEITKRKLYERADVAEYWVVDPDVDAIKVYRRAATGTFARAVELSLEHDDVLTTPLLPGFSVALAVLFAPPM